MLVLRRGLMVVAIIDPPKKYGEEGQYRKYEGSTEDLIAIVARAKAGHKEVRYYYKDLSTSEGEQVPIQVIITEVPPRHVQPFHTHKRLHEITWVLEGAIVAVDSPTLTESDLDGIEHVGILLRSGDAVIENPGVRHTVMNPNQSYSIIYTVQSARIPLESFPKDWIR